MTSKEFGETNEYRALTAIQRNWLLTFIETGDAEKATMAAYPNAKKLLALRHQMQAHPKIIAALELWNGTPAKESAIAELKRDIRRSKGMARVEYKKMLLRLQGLLK